MKLTVQPCSVCLLQCRAIQRMRRKLNSKKKNLVNQGRTASTWRNNSTQRGRILVSTMQINCTHINLDFTVLMIKEITRRCAILNTAMRLTLLPLVQSVRHSEGLISEILFDFIRTLMIWSKVWGIQNCFSDYMTACGKSITSIIHDLDGEELIVIQSVLH